MINTLRDSTRHAVKKQLRLEEELVAEGLMQRPNGGTVNGPAQKQEDERVDVGLKQRLHAIGCCVGGHIAERCVLALSHGRISDNVADISCLSAA
jgi:FAD/FMN-containing dehydrogenase